MRKAINLSVKLYVEADAPPAQDFAKTSIQAVRDIIGAGHVRHPAVKVTIKSIAEDRNSDEDEDGKARTGGATTATSASPPMPKKSES